jgi:hypothetical protein
LSGCRRPYSGSQLGLSQAVWALDADVADYHAFSRETATRRAARPGPEQVQVPSPSRPVTSSPLKDDRGRAAGRSNGRAKAVVQARATVGLAHRIGEIEAQAAALEQRGAEPAGGSVSEAHAATGTLPPGADPDIAALIAQLKVLRRQLALLPERSARRRHMAPRRQTFFSPQLPHKSGCRASAPTENPRTNRHGPA